MKRHIWYHIVLTIFAAWCWRRLFRRLRIFQPQSRRRRAAGITDRQYGQSLRRRRGGKGDAQRQLQRHGPDRLRSGIPLRPHGSRNDEKSERRVLSGRRRRAVFTRPALPRGQRRPLFPGLHGHRRQNLQRESPGLVRGESGFRSGSDHRTVRSRRRSPHAQRQLQARPRPERRGPGFRYAATADGVASVQFVRATQVDQANKTFKSPTFPIQANPASSRPLCACPPTSTTAK